MKRPWWQEPRSWHDTWPRAILGYAMLFALLLLGLIAAAWLMGRAL